MCESAYLGIKPSVTAIKVTRESYSAQEIATWLVKEERMVAKGRVLPMRLSAGRVGMITRGVAAISQW